MNRISAVALSLCLMCAASLALAMEPTDRNGAMEKGATGKEAMKKEPVAGEGAMMMMKAQPKKTRTQDAKTEHGNSMSMQPKK